MKLPARFSFSLFSLFVGCTVAAVLLTVAGLAWRGVGWAIGAGWGLIAWLIAMVIGAGLTWLFLIFARRLASGRSRLLAAKALPRQMPLPAPSISSEGAIE